MDLLGYHDKATQRGVAGVLGVDVATINRLAQRDVFLGCTTVLEWIRAGWADRGEALGGRGGQSQDELTRQRAREASISADLKELQYWREVGELVAVSEIEPRLSGWAVAARSEILGATDKLLAQIESQHDISIDREAAAEVIASALTAIAAYPRLTRVGVESIEDGENSADANTDHSRLPVELCLPAERD